MSTKFELQLLSISTVKTHAWCIMLRFVIFVLDAIFHIWPSSLDMLLVRMITFYGKNFICSTGYLESQTNMQVHI